MILKLAVWVSVFIILLILYVLLWFLISNTREKIQEKVANINQKQSQRVNVLPSAGFVRNGLNDMQKIFYKEEEVLPLVSVLDRQAVNSGIKLSMGGISVDKNNTGVYRAQIGMTMQGDKDSLMDFLNFMKTLDKLNSINEIRMDKLSDSQDGNDIYNMYVNFKLFILK